MARPNGNRAPRAGRDPLLLRQDAILLGRMLRVLDEQGIPRVFALTRDGTYRELEAWLGVWLLSRLNVDGVDWRRYVTTADEVARRESR